MSCGAHNLVKKDIQLEPIKLTLRLEYSQDICVNVTDLSDFLNALEYSENVHSLHIPWSLYHY